jgi:uncharacterized membrane protein
MPILRRAYGPAALAWAALLPLGTYAATRPHASSAVHLFAFAMYAVGSMVCHQRPERSFHVWGAQLPVCARCTGIYVGAAVFVVARAVQTSADRVGESLARRRRLALVAAIPTIATLVYEWTTGDMPSNATRFAAGLPLGAVVSWLVLRASPEPRPTGAIH